MEVEAVVVVLEDEVAAEAVVEEVALAEAEVVEEVMSYPDAPSLFFFITVFYF